MRIQTKLLVILATAASDLAFAQARRDPSDPSLPVPAMADQSAFAAYQSFHEQKPGAWQAIHAEMLGQADASAHAGHTGSTAPAQAEPPSSPTMSEHAEHSVTEQSSASSASAQPTPSEKTARRADNATQSPSIAATGVIREIDRPNNKVKMSHDPIEALGWPQMTMYFRLKDARLADQVKPGDKVEFLLEKATSGYVITGFRSAQ